jgi:outer membrane protein TolC
MRRLAASLLVCFLVLLPLASSAQDAPLVTSGTERPVLRLALAEAVARALQVSATLGQLRALEEVAGAEVQGARAARAPLLELSSGYTRNSDVPELATFVTDAPGALPRRQVIFPNIPDNYRARLGAALPLYTGGRIGSLVDAASAEQAAAGKDLASAEADLVLETSTAYWSLVTAQQAERVLSEALLSYDAHLTDAQNRERFGMAARNDVLAVQVERDRAELGRLRAQNASQLAHANLARLLDVADTRIEPGEPLEREAAARAELPSLIAAALAARPERAALVSRLAAAEARIRAERAARLPQLVASAGYDYANPNRKILPPEAVWNDSWDVSVNLSLSVLDGGRTSANVARATARASALRLQLEDLVRRIRLQVTQRHLELRTADAAADLADRNLEAAHENRRVAAERYREGVIASAELLDAEVALLRVGLERIETLAAGRLAVASLARATGR